MVVRGQSLAASMSDYLIRQIGTLSNIDVRLGTWVVDGHGDRRLEAVTVERVDGKREKLRAAGLFVLVGGTPHTQWLAGTLAMDAKGYILTGRDADVWPAWLSWLNFQIVRDPPETGIDGSDQRYIVSTARKRVLPPATRS